MFSNLNKLTYYGPANLVGILFLVIFLVVSIKKYKNNDDYYEKIKPIKFTFYLLVILEILKIIYHININKSWNPKAFPIIYCSSAMYVYALVSYSKKDSIKARIGLFGSIIPFIIIGSLYFVSFPTINFERVTMFGFIMNIHSRFYHFANLAVAIYILIMKLYDFRFKDWFIMTSVNALYFVFSTALSLFMGGEVSNFGPKSNEAKFIYNITGYAVGNLVIIYLIYIIGFIMFKTIDNLKRNNL